MVVSGAHSDCTHQPRLTSHFSSVPGMPAWRPALISSSRMRDSMSSVLRLRLGARTSYRRDATFNLRRRLLRPLPSLSPPVLAA